MKENNMYCVYIVECFDGLYYVGITNNVENRIGQHNDGVDIKSFTYNRRPVELKYVEIFPEAKQAISWEKQLKGWSRKKKEALFDHDWDKIKELSKPSSSSA